MNITQDTMEAFPKALLRHHQEFAHQAWNHDFKNFEREVGKVQQRETIHIFSLRKNEWHRETGSFETLNRKAHETDHVGYTIDCSIVQQLINSSLKLMGALEEANWNSKLDGQQSANYKLCEKSQPKPISTPWLKTLNSEVK